MNQVDLIALLALIQLFVFSALVGRARGRYGVKAPAVTGHEMFERAYRVQMNTLELMMLFLPALYLGAKYLSPTFAAVAGAVYLVGRSVFAVAYMRDPATRSLGFLLSISPIMVLILGALAMVIKSLF